MEIEDADTLQSALESFTRVEKIESEDMNVTCENCKENVSVEKQIMLDKTPSIAVLHLKRFKNTGFFVEKVDKFVNYPLELDLQPYTLDSKKNDVRHLFVRCEKIYVIISISNFLSVDFSFSI